jgi:hypothetical protein
VWRAGRLSGCADGHLAKSTSPNSSANNSASGRSVNRFTGLPSGFRYRMVGSP